MITEQVRAHVEALNGELDGRPDLPQSVEPLEGDHQDLVALVQLQMPSGLLVLLALVAVPQILTHQALLLREAVEAVVQS